jgi:hypothetical protein
MFIHNTPPSPAPYKIEFLLLLFFIKRKEAGLSGQRPEEKTITGVNELITRASPYAG